MNLRNWEFNATSGAAIAGATVEARAASLSHPNANAVTASTTTDANGMWEFSGLADVAHDIKIVFSGMTWWHKGLTRHSIDSLYFNAPSAITDNYLHNAGFESDRQGSLTVTNVQQRVMESWLALNGAGSSAVISWETPIVAGNSLASAKVVNTRSAGSFQMFQVFAPAAFRTKTVTMTIQLYQTVANSVRAYIYDGITTLASVANATTGSFVTHTVTMTIGSGANTIQVGFFVDLSGTVYADNAVFTLGSSPGIYTPEVFPAQHVKSGDLDSAVVQAVNMGVASVATSALQDASVTAPKLGPLSVGTAHLQDTSVTYPKLGALSVGTANLQDAGVTTAKIGLLNVTTATIAEAAVTDTKMAVQKFNRAGDTVTGTSRIHTAPGANAGYWYFGTGANYIGFDGSSIIVASTNRFISISDMQVWRASAPTSGYIFLGNGGVAYIGISGSTLVANPGSGGQLQILGDAIIQRQAAATTGYVFFGNTGLRYLGYDGANYGTHQGVIWTAGNMGPGSTLDADTVDGYHGVSFALAGHSHAGVYANASHTHSIPNLSGVFQTSNLATTTANATIPGMSFAGAGAGTYVVQGTVFCEIPSGSFDRIIVDIVITSGTGSVSQGLLAASGNTSHFNYAQISIVGSLTATSTVTVALQARKSGGGVGFLVTGGYFQIIQVA